MVLAGVSLPAADRWSDGGGGGGGTSAPTNDCADDCAPLLATPMTNPADECVGLSSLPFEAITQQPQARN